MLIVTGQGDITDFISQLGLWLQLPSRENTGLEQAKEWEQVHGVGEVSSGRSLGQQGCVRAYLQQHDVISTGKV